MERPLRLSVDLSHDRLEPFLAVSLEAGDGRSVTRFVPWRIARVQVRTGTSGRSRRR